MTEHKKIVEKIWSTKAEAFTTDNDPWIGTNRLNIFIGPNNSGKSRFLRTLISSDTSSELKWTDGTPFLEHKKTVDALLNELSIERFFKPPNHTIVPESKYLKDVPISNNEFTIEKNSLATELDRLTNLYRNGALSRVDPERNLLHNLIAEIGETQFRTLAICARANPTWHYVPIMRGLRPILEKIGQDHYKDRTENDYKLGCEIHTGLKLYSKFEEKKLGEKNDQKQIENYETLLSKYFFNGDTVKMTPRSGKDVLFIEIGNEDQRPIYELGDGLQTVIIITAAAFFTETPSLFVIEEPETHLHPGFQRRLLEVLLNETPHQFFITTHSNHFLELAEFRSDINIFRLTKTSGEKTEFQIKTCGQDRDLLRELGVNPASVYLANCTIWVEGITDRLYIQAFLEKYKKDNPGKFDKWIENYHYVFVEYQGSGLAHWDFGDEETQEQMLASITTPNILVIADSDIESKGDRLTKLSSQLKDKIYITPGKEIDNLVPPEFIRAFVKKCMQGMIKENKVKINTNGIKPEYIDPLPNLSNETMGIGWHIDKLLFNRDPTTNEYRLFSKLDSKTGTIRQKVELCKYSIAEMRAVDWDIGDEIKCLCKKIITHITENNPDM